MERVSKIPYLVRKSGDHWKVVKESDGKVIGTHKSKQAAQKQITAILISEHKKQK